MRAEAVSWDDLAVSNPPPIVENDKWHVQFSSDEVKIVSLEQLDDLFRLSIVDSETQVWQTGMSDWQPLRVIAGLDEQPAPEPKRAPPKPPMRAASPSVRPAPPAARPTSPSVRPTPPAPRSAPPAAYVAPASFYPEPIVAAPASYRQPVAYAAPIAFAATMPAANSVRPLVVSQAPPMVQRGGGGFGRFLVGLALLAGVGVTAYRNDFLREGAHAAHQDALYARLEAALGGPAFGTVRALEQSAAAQSAFDASPSNEAAVRTAIPAPSPPAPSSPPSSAVHPPSEAAAAPPIVALESLTQEKKGQAAAVAAPAAVAPAPARAVSLVPPRQTAASAPAKAQQPVRATPAPKAAVEKPAPVAQKPASQMSDRELLNAAIGQSVMMQNAPGKAKTGKAKAKSNNDYDPLNPSL